MAYRVRGTVETHRHHENAAAKAFPLRGRWREATDEVELSRQNSSVLSERSGDGSLQHLISHGFAVTASPQGEAIAPSAQVKLLCSFYSSTLFVNCRINSQSIYPRSGGGTSVLRSPAYLYAVCRARSRTETHPPKILDHVSPRCPFPGGKGTGAPVKPSTASFTPSAMRTLYRICSKKSRYFFENEKNSAKSPLSLRSGKAAGLIRMRKSVSFRRSAFGSCR